MYPFTSRSINIYSWVKCKLPQSSTASNNGVITAQIGCAALYSTLSSFISSKLQNISQHSLFILIFPTTVILEASRNTHIHCVDSCPGKRNWEVDAIIDLQALITCNWPFIDPSYSAKLMTVLITICYWSPKPVVYAQSWTCNVHNHAFWSHPLLNCRDLTLCLSGLSWIYQSAEAKTQPAAVKSPKGMRSLWNCATFGISSSTTVCRSKD